MRPAEGRQKVIECDLVGQVDGSQTQTPFIPIAAEEIIVAHRHIKQIPRFNAGRIEIVILGTQSGDVDSR